MKVPHLFAHLSLALLVVMMAGCGGVISKPFPQQVSQPPPSPQQLPLPPQLILLQSVLEQFGTVQTLSPEQIDAELVVLEQAYTRMPDALNRLRLAVSHGFGRCKICDSGHGLKLFKETLASNQADAVAALVSLSIELLESRAKLTNKDWVLLKRQKQIQQLQQKLNDLASIEKSLHLRK